MGDFGLEVSRDSGCSDDDEAKTCGSQTLPNYLYFTMVRIGLRITRSLPSMDFQVPEIP